MGADSMPDAKLDVSGAKSDLRKEQQREKRQESRETREERGGTSAERSEKTEASTIKMRGPKDVKVRSQNNVMAQKRAGP